MRPLRRKNQGLYYPDRQGGKFCPTKSDFDPRLVQTVRMKEFDVLERLTRFVCLDAHQGKVDYTLMRHRKSPDTYETYWHKKVLER